jgi:hypothetical protein
MNQTEIDSYATAPFKKLQVLSIVTIGGAIAAINTPMENLGYWLFGLGLAGFGFFSQHISRVRGTVKLGRLLACDPSGTITVSVAGMTIYAEAESIVEDAIVPGCSGIKGTTIIFRRDKNAEQGGAFDGDKPPISNRASCAPPDGL